MATPAALPHGSNESVRPDAVRRACGRVQRERVRGNHHSLEETSSEISYRHLELSVRSFEMCRLVECAAVLLKPARERLHQLGRRDLR